MREIVVISGKGGTGKTSIVASFAALAGNAVLADCDVDAADLHLVLSPKLQRREEFRCGHEAVIRQADCIGCGACLAYCRFDAVRRADGMVGEGPFSASARKSCDTCTDACTRSCPVKFTDMIKAVRESGGHSTEHAFIIDPTACEGCGVCVAHCPVKAIDFPDRISGEWFISETRFGPLAHARLTPGGENSGKLVSMVRGTARNLAAEHKADLILVDGPPGVGCAVIASLTGASLALVVTEPTLSGAHDMARVLELTRHFGITTAVCVNKWDVNPDVTKQIEDQAAQAGAVIAGRIRYDRSVTTAQIQGKSVLELSDAPAAVDIRAVWEAVCKSGVK